MTKLCPRGKAAAKRKFKVYPSAYANAYASKICAGKIKDPSGVKRKDFRGPKPMNKGGGVDAGQKQNVKDSIRAVESRKKSKKGYAGISKFNKGAMMKNKEMSNRKKLKQKNDPNKGVTYDRPRGMIGRKPVLIELNKGGGAKSSNMAKINKVVKGLQKASKLHLGQAKTLKTIKANEGAYMGSYIKSEIDGKKISNKSYEKYYKGMI